MIIYPLIPFSCLDSKDDSPSHLWAWPSSCPASNLKSITRNSWAVCRTLNPSWWHVHLISNFVIESSLFWDEKFNWIYVLHLQSSWVLNWASLVWYWASVCGVVGLCEGWYADVAGEVVHHDLDVGEGGVDGGVVQQPAELEGQVSPGCHTWGVNSVSKP